MQSNRPRSSDLAGAEQIEELAGVDDLGNFIVFAEMLEVAGNKECRLGSIGAFVETVVGFVGGNSQSPGGMEQAAGFFQLPQSCGDFLRPESEFRTWQHPGVLCQHRWRNAQPKPPGQSQAKNLVFQSLGLEQD